MCHLQGAPYVLVSYFKVEMFMLFDMYCECWWPVCTGCCGSVCYVVQLSAQCIVLVNYTQLNNVFCLTHNIYIMELK
jgi:hypothetical protein